MGCCQSCRRSKVKKANFEGQNPSNFHYPDVTSIPEENHVPMTDIQYEIGTPGPVTMVATPMNGRMPGEYTSATKRERAGSSNSISKRYSCGSYHGNFYRLSKLGSQYSMSDSIRTDGSTWTIASSTYEPKEIDDPGYATKVLAKLNDFRKKQKYTDLVITCGDHKFPCHKVVLAASSRYFAVSVLDEVNDIGEPIKRETLDMPDLTPKIVQSLLDYIYTSKLIVSNETAVHTLNAARRFHLSSAEQACLEFLERQDNRFRDEPEEPASLSTEYMFEQPYHVNEILLGLNDQVHDGKFIDVSVMVGDDEVKCHRVVLATIDSVMEDRLRGADKQGRVIVRDVSVPVMKMLINYTYTSRLEIVEENAREALKLACRLRHDSAIHKCSEYLKGMLSPSNCLGLVSISTDPTCLQLHKSAARYALKNFRQVITHCEFLELNPKEMIDYLGDDNVDLRSEEEAFEALLKWVQHNVDERRSTMPEALRCIRLPYVSPKYLEEHIALEPLVMESIECERLVQDTRAVQNMIREGRQNNDPRMKPRRSFCDVTFVVGGRNKHEMWIQDTCYYDHTCRKWFPLETMPSNMVEYKVVSLQNDVYVVGGRYKDGEVTGDVWRYNSLFDEWSQITALNMPRACHGLGVLHDRIYAVGGSTYSSNEPSNEVERYNRQKDQWKNSEAMTYGVLDPVVTSHSRRLYVIGGQHQNGNVIVQCFHFDKNMWTVLSDLSLTYEPRIAATLKSKIYLVGGDNEYRVEVYNPNSGDIETVGEMPHAEAHARQLYSATVTNRKINVTGGHWRVGNEDALTIATNSVEQYDPSSNQWTVLGPMPRALTYHGCVTIKRYIGLPKSNWGIPLDKQY